MNEKITVRTATSEDIPSLCSLEDECFVHPWSEKSFSDFFGLPYTVAYVATVAYLAVYNPNDCSHADCSHTPANPIETDGRVIGYAGMYTSFGDGDITNIAVTRGFRRHGVGTALLGALRETEGVNRLLLEVRESNSTARSLYEKYGFKTDCIRRNFYTKPTENAVLMSLNVAGREEY